MEDSKLTLVTLLRQHSDCEEGYGAELADKAADRIEALETSLRELLDSSENVILDEPGTDDDILDRFFAAQEKARDTLWPEPQTGTT